MVLSDRDIRRDIEAGRIVIDPYDEGCIQPASVDLHLDCKLLVSPDSEVLYSRSPFVDVREPAGMTMDALDFGGIGHYMIQPGAFILASTLEHVELPDDLVARLEGKSSLGRLGLLIHSTAGYVDPGWKGQLTLEISNVAGLPIRLYYGMKISQISFLRLTSPAEVPYGSKSLRSKYQGQRGPTISRSYQDFTGSFSLRLPGLRSVRGRRRSAGPGAKLREWLEQSEFRGSPTRLAVALDVPLKALEEWLYERAQPSAPNRAKLYRLTGLAGYRVSAVEDSTQQRLPTESH